jgi:hypothetical protein
MHGASVAYLVRAALTQLDRGDAETAQVLLRTALGALGEAEVRR